MIHGMNKANVPQVYWEHQQGDLMCGLHSVNSILQGPFFDEITLSEVALELDKKEQAMYKKNNMAEKSNNLNDGGYFSLQVLIEAMNKKGHFEVSSIRSEVNRVKKVT